MQGAEWTGIPDESRVPRVCVPLAAFHSENCCLLYADGCEDIEWIREQFGDPVELSQRFIREAYLRFRGIGVCSLLDRYVPEPLQEDHAAFVARARAEYREAIVAAENLLATTGDVAAYDQAVSIAFCRHRGQRFGALEGAFTPAMLPYF